MLTVASEMVPFAKTGGLGDVIGALPHSLMEVGEDVRVVLPLYPRSMGDRYELELVEPALRLPFQRREEVIGVHRWTTPKGLPVYFISKDEYFDRDGLYGTPDQDFPDNATRFSCFALAALEICRLMDWKPDVVHVHDWQAALVSVYLKNRYGGDPFWSGTRSVCTIHNLAFQGIFPADQFGLMELPSELFSIEGLEFYGQTNFLKGGIVFSDMVTTVSERYCQEIQTEEFGHGLAGLLRHSAGKLRGILNGVDYREWDPRADPYLPFLYDEEHIEKKRQDRAALLADFGLPETDSPVIGMVTRLTDQKGIDLLMGAIDRLMSMDLSLIILGMGEKRYQDMLEGLVQRFPKKVAVLLKFDNRAAHRIEAGADIFLMPSRFEPCGLNQIYSLRYGTIPIVRATGGLDDTIKSFDPKTRTGNGFKFKEYTSDGLLGAVREALNCYAEPPLWAALMRNGMSAYYGWDVASGKYQQVYREVCAQ